MRAWRALGVLLLLACACTAPQRSEPLGHVRVGLRTVGSLDPLAASVGETASAEALVLRQVYEGLTDYDAETLEVRPALAKSWKASSGERVFEFELRDATFHDGSRVTAQDVVFSLTRLASAACADANAPTAGAPAYLLKLIAGAATICQSGELGGVRAEGTSTVKITLTEQWADFPAVLATPATAIVSRLRAATLAKRPVGTGPYRVESEWDGKRLELDAFDGYWNGRPPIQRVTFIGYASDEGAYLDLLKGRIEVASVPSTHLGQARRRFGHDGFRRIAGVYFFGFNLRSPRVQQVEFRQAIIRSVDRASLGTAVFEGTREPARGLAPPEVPGSDGASCLPACIRSLDAARAAVKRARPQGVPEITIGVSSAGANSAVGEALARMLADAGVTARVLERSFREHVRGLEDSDTDVFQLGWVPSYPALDGLLVPMFSSTGSENRMAYSNADVDANLKRARGTSDPVARNKLFAQVERKVIEDGAVLPLLWYRSSFALDTRLRAPDGPRVDALGLIRFAELA